MSIPEDMVALARTLPDDQLALEMARMALAALEQAQIMISDLSERVRYLENILGETN